MKQQTKDIPKGYKMTELGPLPGEWEVASLSSVVIKAKQSNPKKRPDWHFKYIDVSSVNRDNLRIEETRDYIGEKAPSRARKKIKAGDVLFATVRPYLKRLSIVPESLDGQICSTAFCVIRANRQLADPSYLFYATADNRFVDRISEKQRGSSYPAVTDKNVLNEDIALPPLPEQKKIASVLSAVQQAKEKTEGAIAALRVLKKSLMKHLFTYGPVPVDEAENVELKETEIGEIPAEWELSTLGSEGEFKYGYTTSATDKKTGTKFLRITDIRDDGRVNWNSVPFAEVDGNNINKYILGQGDILFARIGATTGKTCIISNDRPEAVFASYLIRLRVGSRLDSQYTFYYTGTERYWKMVEAGKEGKLKKGLNSHQLKGFSVPVPSTAEQTDIAKMLSAVDTKLDTLENEKLALDDLFRTLLHDLMTAKIRVNEAEVPV